MSIFKEGYLKKEFINPNYRGLVGWPLDVTGHCDLLMVKKSVLYYWCDDQQRTKETMVKRIVREFKPEDIPVGELCWFSCGNGVWQLHKLRKVVDVTTMHYDKFFPSGGGSHSHCVPYLIAETTEDAERLKDWDK